MFRGDNGITTDRERPAGKLHGHPITTHVLRLRHGDGLRVEVHERRPFPALRVRRLRQRARRGDRATAL